MSATERVMAEVLAEHARTIESLAALEPLVAEAAAMLTASLAQGGRVLTAGNGGSAADAQHMAAEFSGRFLKERRPFPAEALTVNTSAITAIGNDYGFDEVFARQVRASGRAGDVLVVISTSGNSANILRAAEAARDLGMRTVALTGAGGGALAPLADVLLAVPSASTPRVQEGHVVLLHLLCQLVEDALC